MQLSVDVLEVTRLPFSKLETLYFTLTLGITPKGKRVTSNICFAKPSVCFKPRNFSFFLQDFQKSKLSLTLNNYRANGVAYPIAFISIPLANFSQRKVVAVNFAMKSMIGAACSPIVRLELFLSRDPDAKPDKFDPGFFEPEMFGDLEASIVRADDIDYTEYEMPFQCVRGKTGQVSAPQHICEHWAELFRNTTTRDILKQLFLDDVLREQVMKNLRKLYDGRDFVNVSDLTENDGVKVKNRETCVKKVATNYESSTALEFDAPLVKSKSKKIELEHAPKANFHLRTKSQGECDPFAPSPPSPDDDTTNPRRSSHDPVIASPEIEAFSKGQSRSRKSPDDSLPDITRTVQRQVTPTQSKKQIPNQASLTDIDGVKFGIRGFANKPRPQEFHESPPKQMLLRGLPPAKYQQTSPDIEISKPMLRGMPPQNKKQPDLHEKGPIRGLLQQRVSSNEPVRRESPPTRHIHGDEVQQTPKSLMRGLPSFPMKRKSSDDSECEIKPPIGSSIPPNPFTMRPKPHGQPADNGVSPRRPRPNNDG